MNFNWNLIKKFTQGLLCKTNNGKVKVIDISGKRTIPSNSTKIVTTITATNNGIMFIDMYGNWAPGNLQYIISKNNQNIKVGTPDIRNYSFDVKEGDIISCSTVNSSKYDDVLDNFIVSGYLFKFKMGKVFELKSIGEKLTGYLFGYLPDGTRRDGN